MRERACGRNGRWDNGEMNEGIERENGFMCMVKWV